MPRTGVNRLLSEMVSAHGKGVTAADVLTLAHQFRVSVDAIFRRLEALKRLPAGTWNSLRANKFQPDKARTTLGLPLIARFRPAVSHPHHARRGGWEAWAGKNSSYRSYRTYSFFFRR